MPARFAADAAYEAVDSGIGTVIVITEHIPAHEMLRVYTYVRPKGITMIGRELPRRSLAGESERGDHPRGGLRRRRNRARVASGTLTYQIGCELAQLGLGNSSIVGIGGDPVPGSSFIDILEKFEADPQTEMVVMVGEIGGNEEEKAAEFIRDRTVKPVLAYIAGFTAPPGKTMGHAGAIISGFVQNAQAKKEALEACGVARRHDADRSGPARRRRSRSPRLASALEAGAGVARLRAPASTRPQGRARGALDRQLDGRRRSGELP